MEPNNDKNINKSEGTYGKRSIWKWIIVYLVIAVVAYGAIYKVVLSKSYTNTNQVNSIQPTTDTPAAVTDANQQSITVTGSDFSFDPSTITVKNGSSIKLTFVNNGQYPHNFSIGDLNVKTNTIKTGQQETIAFSVNKVGTFQYICTVPGHADRGMVGNLIVQ